MFIYLKINKEYVIKITTYYTFFKNSFMGTCFGSISGNTFFFGPGLHGFSLLQSPPLFSLRLRYVGHLEPSGFTPSHRCSVALVAEGDPKCVRHFGPVWYMPSSKAPMRLCHGIKGVVYDCRLSLSPGMGLKSHPRWLHPLGNGADF